MRPAPDFTDVLPALAARSIAAGFGRAAPADPPALAGLPAALAEPGASFVTLTRRGELRGCRGMLEPVHPLVVDVWRNAWSSAFDDPRFEPLGRDEFTALDIEVAVLSALEPIEASSEGALLEQLEPGVHGLVIGVDARRATFLPKVWEVLPEPARFLAELKFKAGLPRHGWPGSIRAWRYTTRVLETA